MRRKALLIALALVVETAVIAAVPLHEAWIRATGTTVWLAVEPVDPYDALRGYAVTFEYKGLEWNDKRPLSDKQSDPRARYFPLTPGARPGAPWRAGGVVLRRADAGPVALRVSGATFCTNGDRADCVRPAAGAPNAWYVDERSRQGLAGVLRSGRAVAELRVAPSGEAALIGLRAAPR